MKTLILAFATLITFNASADANQDVIQMFKGLCAGIAQQSETSHIAIDYCLQKGRFHATFSTDGLYDVQKDWSGGVMLKDSKSNDTFECGFDIRMDGQFRTYKCMRHKPTGE